MWIRGARPALASAFALAAMMAALCAPLLAARTRVTTVERIALATHVTLDYAECGDSAGIPVVLLHGYTDSRRSYGPLVAALPPRLRTFAVSLRGHGDSDAPPAGYQAAEMARDVAAFLDAKGIASAVVVGHSMGSTVAQRFAIDFPERTRGLVLIGAVPTWKGVPAAAELRGIVAGLKDPVDPTFVVEFQRSTLAQPVPADFLDTVVSESRKVRAFVWRAALAGLLDVDFSSELPRIQAPTCLLWGAKDTHAVRAHQEALTALIPQSRLIAYDDAGHAPHWEEPRRVGRDLAAFAESLGDVQRTEGPRPGR